MSNGSAHLEDGDLLRLIDGETPEREAALMQSHIEACWTCRARLQEIETAIGEYVRYQKTADPLLPPAPRAWRELRFETAPARRRFDLRWALAAAAMLIAVLVVRRFEHAPTVSAAELLEKANAAEPSAASKARRVQFKTRRGNDARLRGMFERTHFDWEQPLSARAFAAWRNQLPEKHDDVQHSEKDGVYVIRTATNASELRQATLTLRDRDLHPVREMLEFIDETVEISEAPEPVLPPAQIAAAPAPRPEKMPAPSAPAISPLHRKLEVFSTLHRLGADLGDPVEIHQQPAGVEVIATGFTAARREQLRAALESIPDVAVRFDEGAPKPMSARNAPKPMATLSSPGSAPSNEEFTNRALDASDAVLARVHALRALAHAFPAAQEAEMPGPDRQLLTRLRADHAAALTRRIADLRATLQPAIGSSSPTPETQAAGSWQDAAQDLFTAAQQFDEALNRELAGGGKAGNSGFARIAEALSRLENQAVKVTRP